MKVLFSHYFRKMLLVLLIAGLFPVLVLGMVFVSVYESSLYHMTVENADVQSAQVSSDLDEFISRCAQLGQTAAGQMEVKSVLSYLPGKVEIATLQQMLDLLTVNTRNLLAVHVVGENHALSSTQVPSHYLYENFSKTEVFQRLDGMPRASVFFSKPYTDQQNRRVVLSVIMPVCDYHNHFVGYAIVDIYQSSFVALLGQMHSSLDMALWYDGTLLVDTSPGGLPVPSETRAKMPEGTEGVSRWIREDGRSITWSQGQYNRLERVFSCDISQLSVAKQTAMALLAMLLAFIALMSVVMAVTLSVHQSRPIIRLHRAMDEVGKGNLNVHFEVKGWDELADLGRRFNRLVDQLAETIRERTDREKELRRQEIAALQAQINPHFIYNTMGAARSLIRMGLPDKASLTIQHLSMLLHANLQAVDKLITLKEDADLIYSYMVIQNIRFNNRFTLHLNIPEELNRCLLPSLLLQPIVENAVKHDLEPKQGKGTLWVSARREDDDVILTVENDGVGIDRTRQEELNALHPRMDHIGYLNVRRRIELYYGSGYTTRIVALDKGTRVTLRIRYAVEDEHVSDHDC